MTDETPKLDPRNDPLWHRVAVLDTETLDLADTGVIWELGLIVVDCKLDYTSPIIVSKHCWQLPVVPQLARGRTASASTLKWMSETYSNFETLLDDRPNVTTVGAVMFNIKDLLDSVKELWVNHTDFDLPKIRGLARAYNEDPEKLWHYRTPHDLYTLRSKFGLTGKRSEPTKGVDHRALADCEWMLNQLKLIGKKLYPNGVST